MHLEAKTVASLAGVVQKLLGGCSTDKWARVSAEYSSVASVSFLTPSWLFCSTLKNGCFVLP